MNDNVSHGDRWDVVADRDPVSTDVPRCKYSQLSATIEQGPYLRVLANNVNVPFRRKITFDRSPGLAEVSRLERPRSEVVVLMTIERNIGSSGVEVGGVDIWNPRI